MAFEKIIITLIGQEEYNRIRLECKKKTMNMFGHGIKRSFQGEADKDYQVELNRYVKHLSSPNFCSSACAVELNAAIIVSSAPAFSNFARTKLAHMSLVRSFLDSFPSLFHSSKILDSEAASTSNRRAPFPSEEDMACTYGEHREAKNTWLLKTAANAAPKYEAKH
ncbi:hypothetical protein AAL_07999 [Moelleriella libera RCEF 2490]|uniref:Uncharacterized protein n=1 Tax=Moelleriella libera RCEF 2490 TaxID=1081109 RepID=A0A167WFZ0_9HYPO|nr:hypothetical protein AAL_07999 [Moelleriella libera RCEF 2490]